MRAEEMSEQPPLEEMYRSIRDPGSAVWREACTVLGECAFSSAEAREELSRLLQCPLRELRLRGTVALAGFASRDAEAARDLAKQYLMDETTWQDPLLADALFALVPYLPPSFAHDLVAIALVPENVIARASLAASLGTWWEWPEDLPVRLAHDPSPLVRASLAISLPLMRGHPAAEEARQLFETSDEEWLRAFIDDEFEPPPPPPEPVDEPEAEAPEETLAQEPAPDDAPAPVPDDVPPVAAEGELAPDDVPEETDSEDAVEDAEPLDEEEPPPPDPLELECEALVQDALSHLDVRECPMHVTARVEAFLDAHPDLVIAILHPLVPTPGALSLLDGVAYLARSLDVAQACRALHRVLSPSRERADRRLQDLAEALQAQQGVSADLLRERTAVTIEALRLRGPREMIAWLTRREAAGDRMWAPLGEVLSGLEQVAGMVALQETLAQFERGIDPAEDDNVRPWDVLFGMVVEAWTEILDQEIQIQVSGAG